MRFAISLLVFICLASIGGQVGVIPFAVDFEAPAVAVAELGRGNSIDVDV